MTDTLAALHSAILEAPTDRTVRLVFADALDETGDPAHAARAEFIRKHIDLESTPEGNPELAARCNDLFVTHWIDWWRPICAAVGLPEPFVPKHRLRDRVKRLVRSEKRELGAPYKCGSDYPGAYAIQSDEHGFTVQFIAGFPELLYVRSFPPGEITSWLACGEFIRWTQAVPLARIRFGNLLTEPYWQMLDGPHLERIAELTFDGLTAPLAKTIASSPNLAQLEKLKVLPISSAVDVVRELVYLPTWRGLRSLTLTGATPPDAIQLLADRCTLEELETLSFSIGEVPEFPNVGGLGGPIGFMLNEVLAQFFGGTPNPPGPIRWPDYWPALTALARSTVLPRLRTLRISDSGPGSNRTDDLFRLFVPQVVPPQTPSPPETLLPDELVRALAARLNPDRLVRLELPAARIALSGRAELTHRFGPRVVLT